MGKRILVTGGAGFIATNTIRRLLNKGHQVVAIDNFDDFYLPALKRQNVREFKSHPAYTFHELNVMDSAQLSSTLSGSFDAIIHFAARPGVRNSIKFPEITWKNNLDGTDSMLRLAVKLKIPHFIFASSSSVYGSNLNMPWKESDLKLQPISPYAESKIAAEALCKKFSVEQALKVTVLRFFSVYGPHQRPDLVLTKFTKKILAGESIPVFGDGSTRRDYTHVEDIVSGIEGALVYRLNPFEIINLGKGDTTTLMDFIRTLEEILETKSKHKLVAYSGGRSGLYPG